MKKCLLSRILAFVLVSAIAIVPKPASAASQINGETADMKWQLDGSLLKIEQNSDESYTTGDYDPYMDVQVLRPWEEYADQITHVEVGEGIQYIGTCAFAGFENLEHVSLPSTLYSIERQAFYGCSSLRGIEIPDSVGYIDMQAFANCSSLEEITLPSDLWTIHYGVFQWCTALENVYIPRSVTTIEEMAFLECDNLNVYYGGSQEDWSEVVFFDDEIKNATKYYKAAALFDTTESNIVFSDVPALAYYRKELVEVVGRGIITGYEDGTFRDQNTLTRAEAAVIMCRLNGEFDLPAKTTAFHDVSSDHWASGAIARAAEKGIINGMGDNKYAPGNPLTVGQFSKMLVLWLGLAEETPENWPLGYYESAMTAGLYLNTIGEEMADVNAPISRANACVMIYRALNYK